MPAPEDISFDAATAVRPTARPGVFETDVHPLWTVGDKPNGGYLLALLGRAARARGRRGGSATWEMVSSAITYLRPPELGPATHRAPRAAAGPHGRPGPRRPASRTAPTSWSRCVLASCPTRVDALRRHRAAQARPIPSSASGPARACPAAPRSGSWRSRSAARPGHHALRRVAAAADARAELRGWTRFVDGREPDPLSLLFFIDAIPPATFMIGSTGWVPTLQMSAYVRARPAPGWLGIRMTANLVAGGMVDETCVLWDTAGQVVAQASSWPACASPTSSAEPTGRTLACAPAHRSTALLTSTRCPRAVSAARRCATPSRLGRGDLDAIAQLCRRTLTDDPRPKSSTARSSPTTSRRRASAIPDAAWSPSSSVTTGRTSGCSSSTVGPRPRRRACAARGRRGVGSGGGAQRLITGADPPYFLWPGVPSTETGLLCLLERRHYSRAETNFNMDVDLTAIPDDPGGHDLARPDDRDELDAVDGRPLVQLAARGAPRPRQGQPRHRRAERGRRGRHRVLRLRGEPARAAWARWRCART